MKEPTVASLKQRVNYGVIKHTIAGKHEIILSSNTNVVPLQQHPKFPPQQAALVSTRISWPKHLQEKYLEELGKKGLFIGAKVKTIYERTGVITGYKTPEDSITFFAHKNPNVIQIRYDDVIPAQNIAVWFNEDEVTPIYD